MGYALLILGIVCTVLGSIYASQSNALEWLAMTGSGLVAAAVGVWMMTEQKEESSRSLKGLDESQPMIIDRDDSVGSLDTYYTRDSGHTMPYYGSPTESYRGYTPTESERGYTTESGSAGQSEKPDTPVSERSNDNDSDHLVDREDGKGRVMKKSLHIK